MMSGDVLPFRVFLPPGTVSLPGGRLSIRADLDPDWDCHFPGILVGHHRIEAARPQELLWDQSQLPGDFHGLGAVLSL